MGWRGRHAHGILLPCPPPPLPPHAIQENARARTASVGRRAMAAAAAQRQLEARRSTARRSLLRHILEAVPDSGGQGGEGEGGSGDGVGEAVTDATLASLAAAADDAVRALAMDDDGEGEEDSQGGREFLVAFRPPWGVLCVSHSLVEADARRRGRAAAYYSVPWLQAPPNQSIPAPASALPPLPSSQAAALAAAPPPPPLAATSSRTPW
jgi:hypothetical protein